MEKLEKCPICNNNTLNKFISCIDFTVSKEVFDIDECEKCSFKFTNPRPNINEIGKYYQSETYISHSDTNKGLVSKIYKWVRSYTLSKKVNLINKINNYQKGIILDIGCGTGYFLKECQDNKWQVNGIEPDDNARKLAVQNLSQNIKTSLFELENNKAYDVITMWHVLEHVHDLNKTLEKLKNLLKENGKIVIAVPNYECYEEKIYKEYWAAYDVPRHLNHFSKNTIIQLFKNTGLKNIAIEPMYFDSTYISMLSSKYKNGKTNYIESIYTGLKSNIKAKNKQNYSSLIYIFEK